MIIAMQGLFMLYRASKDILASYHPTRKFATIKLIVIIGAIQKLIIQSIVKPDAALGQYDNEALASMWDAFILAIECPFFALAMTYAFPDEELRLYISEGLHKVEEAEANFEEDKPKKEQAPKEYGTSEPVELDLNNIEVHGGGD